MASKKHIDTAADLDKAYEQNEIQLKGILGFGVGLFLLIVVTFALMWALLNVLTDYWEPNVKSNNPMAMSDKERLPPEPRLQAAPGFGVESATGRINMELGAPQAEYRELRKQWEEMWKNGEKDKKTGAVTMMPIEEAKAKFLSQNAKAKFGADVEKTVKDSTTYYSDASSGRVASETRR